MVPVVIGADEPAEAGTGELITGDVVRIEVFAAEEVRGKAVEVVCDPERATGWEMIVLLMSRVPGLDWPIVTDDDLPAAAAELAKANSSRRGMTRSTWQSIRAHLR